MVLSINYNDGLQQAGEHLKKNTEKVLLKEQAGVLEKIANLEEQLQTLKNKVFSGTKEKIYADLKERKIEKQKIKKNKEELLHKLKYLEDAVGQLDRTTDSVAVRQLVENIAIKLGQVTFKEKKFAFLTFKTNVKQYYGELPFGLYLYENEIKALAKNVNEYIEGRKKGVAPTNGILAKGLKVLDSVREKFLDPKKGLIAAAQADRALEEIVLSKEKEKDFKQAQALRDKYPSPNAEKLYKLFVSLYEDLEKEYKGHLHKPDAFDRFQKKVKDLSKEYSARIKELQIPIGHYLQRLRQHNAKIKAFRAPLEEKFQKLQKVKDLLTEYRNLVRDSKAIEANEKAKELKKQEKDFPKLKILDNLQINEQTLTGYRSHSVLVGQIEKLLRPIEVETNAVKGLRDSLKPKQLGDTSKMTLKDIERRYSNLEKEEEEIVKLLKSVDITS